MRSSVRIGLCVGLALLAEGACAGEEPRPSGEGAPFKKAEAKHIPLQQPLAVESPGLLDPGQRVEIAFPEKGERANLPLPPHEDRMLTASLQNDELWVDFDGDSSKGRNEVFRRSPAGFGPIKCELAFTDGTKTPYEFVLLPVGETNRWRLVRACAKTAEIEGVTVTLIDDNNNGRLDDYGADSLLIQGQPPCLLSRAVYVRGKLFDLVAHPAGNTIEYRPHAGPTEFVDMFQKYKPPQKGCLVQTLIVGSEKYFFAFDERTTRLKLPLDVYSLRFGLLTRSKENVAMLKGEWPSFRVKQDEPAAPAWGGEARGAFELSQDGRYLQVKNVGFVGEAGERYVPLSLDVIPMRAFLARITKDTRTNLDVITPQGNKRFEIGPDGMPLTLTFEPPISGEERVIVEYTSGVLGRVMREERITFVKARRTGQDPPK